TAATGVLSGTPAAGAGGTYALHFAAHNGAGADATQSFTLTVNEAPTVISLNNVTFKVGTAGTFTVMTGHAFPAAVAIGRSGALPDGVTFADNHDGTATLAGTPLPGTIGGYPLTLTAGNGV